MFLSGKLKTALSVLLFCASMGHAMEEKDSIMTVYCSQKGIDKVLFYESLSLNQKRAYKNFFYLNLPKLTANTAIKTSKKDYIKFLFALAEVYNIKGEEVKSIGVLKEIKNNKEYRLSDLEYMNLLVALQKSYLNLNLYSNVFHINSEIATLRKQGVPFPLWSYNIKSQLYARLFLYDKAIIQLKSEIKELLHNPERDALIIPSAYNDLGFYYSLNNNIDSAFHYYRTSLKLSGQHLKKTHLDSYERLAGTIKGNMAVLYFKAGDYKTAVSLLKEDIAVTLKNKDDNVCAANSLLFLTESESRLKHYAEAQKAIALVEKLLPNITDPATKIYFYKTKAELLKSLNQMEEAYQLYKKAFYINDSINKIRQHRLLEGNEILYHLEKQDDLIASQQIDLTKKRQNTLLIILFGLLVTTFFFFLYLVNSKKKQLKIQKMNAEISSKNRLIKESLSEKEMLLKEIHHRVNNNLQIISGILELQNSAIADPDAKVVLQEGQARIQSISLIHKTLYQSDNFNKVPFQSYLNELIGAIQKTYRQHYVSVQTDIDAQNIELNINTAIPLSLIINEIVTNCFKHAFKKTTQGTIKVTIKKEAHGYVLCVQDNGIGFPENFNPKDLHSIGFDLIQGLTKQLDGAFQWKSNHGTEIIITFKEIVN